MRYADTDKFKKQFNLNIDEDNNDNHIHQSLLCKKYNNISTSINKLDQLELNDDIIKFQIKEVCDIIDDICIMFIFPHLDEDVWKELFIFDIIKSIVIKYSQGGKEYRIENYALLQYYLMNDYKENDASVLNLPFSERMSVSKNTHRQSIRLDFKKLCQYGVINKYMNCIEINIDMEASCTCAGKNLKQINTENLSYITMYHGCTYLDTKLRTNILSSEVVYGSCNINTYSYPVHNSCDIKQRLSFSKCSNALVVSLLDYDTDIIKQISLVMNGLVTDIFSKDEYNLVIKPTIQYIKNNCHPNTWIIPFSRENIFNPCTLVNIKILENVTLNIKLSKHYTGKILVGSLEINYMECSISDMHIITYDDGEMNKLIEENTYNKINDEDNEIDNASDEELIIQI